jgi:hypothetical protein
VKLLPAIFPMVLNGKRKWTTLAESSDLIEGELALGEYALQFKYLLLNEKLYSRARLLTIRNIVSTLFLAEAHYDIQLLEAELLNLYEREEDKQAVSLFLNWFRQLALHGKVSPDDYAQLDTVYRTKEEVRTMLVATLEQERKKIYQTGQTDGLAEGLAAGMQAQRHTLLQFLQWRFQPTVSEQTQLAQQLAQINDLAQLTALTDEVLQVATLVEFTTKLIQYLPSAKGNG